MNFEILFFILLLFNDCQSNFNSLNLFSNNVRKRLLVAEHLFERIPDVCKELEKPHFENKIDL